VFKEILLKLGQGALEDYVKDALKTGIGDVATLAQNKLVQEGVGEALTAFLLLVQDELMEWEVSPAEIRNRYERQIEQFIHDEEVKPTLGKAF
jgi:hypothetical protein